MILRGVMSRLAVGATLVPGGCHDSALKSGAHFDAHSGTKTGLVVLGALSDRNPRRMEYQVIEVPAGQYVFSAFSYRADRATGITNFVGRDADRPASPSDRNFSIGTENAPKFGRRLLNPNRSFTVTTADIVTIGETSIDASGFPAQIAVVRNDAAAQSALRAYRDVSGDLVFRPVFGP